MNVEQLQTMQQASPFRPYRIHVADGRFLDVHHRDFVARSPTGRIITVFNSDETFEIIDLLLVSSLEVLNGHSTQKRST